MPDFFDRLLARSMPMGAPFESVAGAVPARVRVPERFERVAAVPEPEEQWVPATSHRPGAEPPVSVTERVPRMVVPPTEPAAPVPPARIPEQPPARAAGRPMPGPAPVPVSRRREPGGARSGLSEPTPALAQPSGEAPVRPDTRVTVVAAAPLLVPPKTTPAPVVPAAAPAAGPGGRRFPAAAAERTVHVRIGRIEVTAPGPAQPAPRPRPQRAAPLLSLERYLGGEPTGRGTR